MAGAWPFGGRRLGRRPGPAPWAGALAGVCDDGRMPQPPRDPLLGIERLIVDGTNLLHAMREGSAAAPPAALIGRLRAVVPASVRIELLFDGPPERGLHGTRIASGVTVRHAGRLSADALAIRLVTEATGGHPDPAGQPALLVVTDDGNLARELRIRGAATIGASWLTRRLARPRLASVSVGRPRPPVTIDPQPEDRDREAGRPGWRPGRGATAKRGNPKRGRPSSSMG